MNDMTPLDQVTREPNGPNLWDNILAKMPKGSVIAGGAVRDFCLGVEPKDIDVFMGDVIPDAPPNQDDYFIEPFEARAGLYRIDNIWERKEEYEAMTGINLVSSGTLLGYRVDAIVMDNFNVSDLIAGFDFGITRCFFDGEIHVTDEHLHDMENHCVTLLLTDRLERSKARFERFNERMGGGWNLVVPA